MNVKKFTVGCPWLMSGGTGPDPYVVRVNVNPKGGWFFLVFHYGHNFDGNREHATRDFGVLSWILKNSIRICTSDAYRRWYMIREGAGGIEGRTVCAYEFAKANGYID